MKMETDSKEANQLPEGSKTWEYLAIWSCCILSLSFGTINGWNSPSGVKLLSPDSPIAVTASEFSIIVIMQQIGYTLGPPINAFVVDRIGRKHTILLSTAPLIVSWSLIMLAANAWELYAARFLGGLFFGLIQCTCPIYLGEISSPKIRGVSSAIIFIAYDIGVIITYISVPYLSISATSGLFLAIAVVFVIVFCFMPESPYYLAMKNKLEDANETLRKLRGKTDVTEDLAIIMASLPGQQNNDGNSSESSWKHIFTVRANRHAFIIALALVMIRFCGGFYTIFIYGQLIFQETSNAISDYTANVSVGISMCVASFVITFLVDVVGRRPLIWFSGVIGGLCCFGIGGFFYVADYMDLDVSGFALVPFIASVIMVFVFSCGIVNLQFIMSAELFATDIKAVSSTLIGVIGGVLAMINCELYFLIAVSWGYGNSVPFLASGVLTWIFTFILLYYTPETKGKTLAEIQEQLDKKR